MGVKCIYSSERPIFQFIYYIFQILVDFSRFLFYLLLYTPTPPKKSPAPLKSPAPQKIPRPQKNPGPTKLFLSLAGGVLALWVSEYPLRRTR